MQHVLRWIFLTGPVRAYKCGEATGGRVPWLHLVSMAGLMGAGGVVGAVVGMVFADPQAGTAAGVAVAGGTAVAWWLYVLLLVVVMRVRNKPLERLLE